MSTAKVTDLDALLAEHAKAVESKRQFIKVKLFDREWRVSNQINAFTGLRAADGDVEAFVSFIMNVTHPDERADFHKALYSSDLLDEEGLLMIISNLMETIAAHPTKSSSGSSRSVKTRAAPRKSAAS